ncbi:uncharacterized protein BDR25DRAFT_238033, partial [Lindgomyces ingoldianus]
AKVDIEYLQSLFEHGLPAENQQCEHCFVVEPTSARGENCNKDHPQGVGKLTTVPCLATWQIIIPVDLRAIPYYVLIAIGTHTHVPPPPSVVQGEYVEDLKDVLRPMLTPGLTRSQFLNSRALHVYLDQHGYRSIEDLHVAFANKDRVSSIIKSEKLSTFPYGGGLQSVVYEWRTRHQTPEIAYIRQIISGVSGNIIVCFFDEQAKILMDQKTFQIDMSYKRLQGKWAEILIAVFHGPHSRMLTLGRIVTDTDSRDISFLGFCAFFKLVGERTQKIVQWQHLHKKGFYGTTLDMCSKQMKGFGLYLQTMDMQQRDWRWQLASCTRFCLAHFTRSINTAAPTSSHSEDSVWSRMRSLCQVETAEDYNALCNLLIQSEESVSVKNWALNKKSPVIAAGIARCCSLMTLDTWNTLETHTNAAEQAGMKGYRTGIRVSLLEAIQKYDSY